MTNENQPTFDIPSLIPPLPSALSGKENERRAPAKQRQNLSVSQQSPAVPKSSRLKPLGLRTPQTKPESKTCPSTSSSLPRHRPAFTPSPGGRPLSSSTTKRRSVLRVGENTETLFCLNAESIDEHRSLCKGIVDGSLADDASVWRRVLELSERNSKGADLIRLYRRATLRFSIDQPRHTNNQDVVSMWLAFAAIQVKLGMSDEARRTYRHIENQKIQLGASFYVKASQLEKEVDMDRARAILRSGLAAKAQPMDQLQQALDALGTGKAPDSSTWTDRPAALSPRKRQKTDVGFLHREFDSEGGKGTEILRSSEKSVPILLKSKPGLDRIEARATQPSKMTTSARKVASRSSRLSSRLSRKGLSGKAKRVEHEISMVEESDSETEHSSDPSCENGVAKGVECDSTKDGFEPGIHKFKKVDLSYMWEWNPSARGETEKLKRKNPSSQAPVEPTHGPLTSTSRGTNSSGDSTATVSLVPSETRSSQDNLDKAPSAVQSPNLASDIPVAVRRDSQRQQNEVPPNVNREFLPLVHEDNILRVSGTSYAKLGVVGKGGSCKVYRALSKKCSVVAVKKVKIEGMEKKAIEGYANEISLLKRLRGNPAIIQMHDSEVALDKKCIYLVMELGEVDLNHVLQQRAVSGTCRSLNLNFIRLTWQQMLSAVHSIHEERIIHSDLKPANFLFVRGALKLIDFGIAKAIQSDDTTNIYRESHIGTLNYMSPEAILDTGSGTDGPRMKIGRASDVWSLGCILYEMIYGKTPFAQLHFIQKLQAIVNPKHDIQFPREADEAALDAIKKCLLRNPDERPPIVGTGGLLNEHMFLHGSSRNGGS